jgi:hypothetical protein
MLCTQAANGDSAFHTKLRLNVCELNADARSIAREGDTLRRFATRGQSAGTQTYTLRSRIWDVDVAGSNPVIPTTDFVESWVLLLE